MGVLYCWIYVFSTCLRAPRKIDSSIGLPSLNKVVTYLSESTHVNMPHCWKSHNAAHIFVIFQPEQEILVPIAYVQNTPMNTGTHSYSLVHGTRRWGTRGPDPPEISHIWFLSNTGPDPLKNHKATKPAFNVGPPFARQRNTAYSGI